jgi:FixJ family two-component response regulator
VQRNLIAVVDDDRGILTGIGRVLEANGFQTMLFASAEAFMANAAGTEAACLVLDIDLPGMSGIDLRRKLLRSGVSIPVIFVTAADTELTYQQVNDVGCAACLPKPFSSMALLGAVRKALGIES